MTCPTPTVNPEVKVKGVWFQLDNVRVHYESIKVPVCLSTCLSVSAMLLEYDLKQLQPHSNGMKVSGGGETFTELLSH